MEDHVAWFDFVFGFKGQCLFGQSICLAFQGQTDHQRHEWSVCSQPFLMGLWWSDMAVCHFSGSLLSRSLAQRVFLMSTQNKVPCDQLPVYCKFIYGEACLEVEETPVQQGSEPSGV